MHGKITHVPFVCSNLLFLTCFKGSHGMWNRLAHGALSGTPGLSGAAAWMHLKPCEGKGSVAIKPLKPQGGAKIAATPRITSQRHNRVLCGQPSLNLLHTSMLLNPYSSTSVTCQSQRVLRVHNTAQRAKQMV